MEKYNFNVKRNGVTLRIIIMAHTMREAEESLKMFLEEKTSTYEYVGSFIES
jgi:hypothetical protein